MIGARTTRRLRQQIDQADENVQRPKPGTAKLARLLSLVALTTVFLLARHDRTLPSCRPAFNQLLPASNAHATMDTEGYRLVRYFSTKRRAPMFSKTGEPVTALNLKPDLAGTAEGSRILD